MGEKRSERLSRALTLAAIDIIAYNMQPLFKCEFVRLTKEWKFSDPYLIYVYTRRSVDRGDNQHNGLCAKANAVNIMKGLLNILALRIYNLTFIE